MRWLSRYALIAACGLLAGSCSVTRHLPPDVYMLTSNTIETDKSVPVDERISAGEFDTYIRQEPARKFLGTNLPVWLYNQADPEKNNGWNNLLRKLGSEPVILDTMLTELSARNIKLYMNSRGFYESESDYRIRLKPRKQKASVTYSVRQGRPYRIASLSYDYEDKIIEREIVADSASTLIRPGDIFDLNALNDERKRIVDYLKDQGYYRFSIDNISYIADTTAGDHLVDLTMVVRKQLEGYDQEGNPIRENNAIYRLSAINVFPAYDATLAVADPDYLRTMDTTYYQGLNIITHGRPRIKPSTLRRAIPIYPDYLYSTVDRQRTSGNLQRLGYFTNASVVFSVPRSTGDDNYVTYIGDDTSGDAPLTAAEKPLVCNIYCTPALRQGYTLDFEATTSSAFYALRPKVSYLNRNLFRGAELLNISLSGGYEFNTSRDAANSYDIGLSASISFPRFFAPFRIDRANKLFNPQTRFEATTSLQRKAKYHRTVSGVNFGYSWSNGRHSSYALRPLNINVVDVNYIDRDFLCDIKNTYLRESYKSQYIAAISGSYIYNDADFRERGHTFTFRVNAETAGNITDGLAHWLSHPVTEQVNTDDCGQGSAAPRSETFYKLFGIRYSQYFRIDASVSGTIPLGFSTALACRFFAGIALPYGNSTSLPMDRMFYVGGGNSLRGWPVRALGPGASPKGQEDGFKDQLGNMRLEANAEFRFPIWNALHGAVFVDAGNVWFAGMPGAADDEVFRLGDFYKQLGINTGIGIRYDLDLVVIRLDWGIRLHDPSLPAGQRWIHDFRWANTALNFGIGYPF